MYIHVYIDIGAKYFENQSYMYMYMYLIDHTFIVQIIYGHGWLAIVTGVATGNMHLPVGMIQMKSISRWRCARFFSHVLFDTSRSIVCYSVEYYIIRLWPVYTHDSVFAVIPRTVVVEHTAVVRDSLEESE
jgi:hypothetical protein